MITLIKMKYKEWKLKLAFYTMIEEHSDIIKFVSNLYDSLKDTPAEELQEKLIKGIAELAHSQAIKEKNK